MNGILYVYCIETLIDSKQLQGNVSSHKELFTPEYYINETAIDGTIKRVFKGWRYKYKVIFDRLNESEMEVINWLYKWMQVDDIEIRFQPDPDNAFRVYEIFNSNDYNYNFIANKTFLDKRGGLELTAIDLLASIGYFYDGKTNTIISSNNSLTDFDISYKIAKGDATRLFICGNLNGNLIVYINEQLSQQITRNGYFQIFMHLPDSIYYKVKLEISGRLDEYLIFQDRS